MQLATTSLNSLRAFEAAARHLNLTRAAEELCVTQTAVSHQVKALEAQLGRALFHRGARGLQLTEEGELLAPPLHEAFALLQRALLQLDDGGPREPLSVGVVGTFAQGLLLEALPRFRQAHPRIELRLQTHNNKPDLQAEALDAAILFGDGAWRGLRAEPLLEAPLSPLCAPALLPQLRQPEQLRQLPLLRSFRATDWAAWGRAAGIGELRARGPQFDSSVLMVQAAQRGHGVALAPPRLFQHELRLGLLAQPFALDVDCGRYWLVQAQNRRPRKALRVFTSWLQGLCAGGLEAV